MGGVSADGPRLWLSGRYDSEVYVFDTATGALVGRIPTDPSPHGLAVWPQPGRYSLGHTGNTPRHLGRKGALPARAAASGGAELAEEADHLDEAAVAVDR